MTIENVIDDVDSMERYFAEDPETTDQCVRIIMKRMLFTPEYISLASGNLLSSTLTTDMLFRVLNSLWYPGLANDKLLHAARVGATAIIPYLMSHGVHYTDWKMVVKIAAANGHVDTLRLLMDEVSKADPTSGYADYYSTIIRSGAGYGQPDVVEYGIASGIPEVNYTLDLHSATQAQPTLFRERESGYERIGNILLEHGANPDAFNTLQMADKYGNVGLARAIRKHTVLH